MRLNVYIYQGSQPCKIANQKLIQMKSTGKADKFDKLNQKPEIPFLSDLKGDIISIDKFNTKTESIRIKKLMINELLNSL